MEHGEVRGMRTSSRGNANDPGMGYNNGGDFFDNSDTVYSGDRFVPQSNSASVIDSKFHLIFIPFRVRLRPIGTHDEE
jgi:hypothetical protein